MASNLNPVYAYTIVFVKDVSKSVAFYSKAFGTNVRRLDESKRWGELETGQTTLAFTPAKQHETDDITGHVESPVHHRNPVEVCFDYSDVDAAYKEYDHIVSVVALVHRALENGAVEVSKPEQKEWGQKVGYVRDIDGIVVRIGSHVR